MTIGATTLRNGCEHLEDHPIDMQRISGGLDTYRTYISEGLFVLERSRFAIPGVAAFRAAGSFLGRANLETRAVRAPRDPTSRSRGHRTLHGGHSVEHQRHRQLPTNTGGIDA